MGVFNGRGANIDPYEVSIAMRDSLRGWQTVRTVIIDPGTNNVNLTTKNNVAFKWDGWARYQPYRKDIPIAQVTNPTTTATARFQIDFTKDGALPDIKTNYIVLIVSGPGVTYPDPFITQYVHVVTSAMNSSLAWIRTVETIVDTRTRENYAIEPDGTGHFRWIP